MSNAAQNQSPLITGIVESISKDSIIVTVGGNATTLKGPKIELLAPELKLGDSIEFDNATLVQVAQKSATKTTGAAKRVGAGSPTAPLRNEKIEF